MAEPLVTDRNDDPKDPGDGQNGQTPQGSIAWEKLPEERQTPRTSVAIFFITATAIFVYGMIYNTETEYAEQNNATVICYTKKEPVTHPVFFNLGLGLLSIILGTFVDRLSLVVDELRQYEIRYNRDIKKVFKTCFLGGISWHAVLVVFLIVVLSLVLGRKTSFKLADGIYILGGIGVGPLVIHLLNLNTNSDIAVSRILEGKKTLPGYILAWSYYFNYLEKELKTFRKAVSKNSKPKPGKIKLTFDKMLLLLPPGIDMCEISELVALTASDENAIKVLDPAESCNPYPFPVYQIKGNDNEPINYVAMQCVKEPIFALRHMETRSIRKTQEMEPEHSKILHDKICVDDELKRLYKTLTEILKNPPDNDCALRGLVVPIKVEIGQIDDLKDGGLVRIIMEKLNDIGKDKKPVNRRAPTARPSPRQNVDDGTSTSIQIGGL